MTSEADYGVDVYQLNVGPGDSAIYVQFRTTGTATKTPLSIVLIDGGDTQGNDNYPSPWAQVVRTLNQIKDDFKLTELPKFTSIVATHWDDDHTKGLVEMIHNDLRAGINANPSYDKVSFMMYNATTNEPETVLYVPFWTAKDSTSGFLKLRGAEKYHDTLQMMEDPPGTPLNKLQFTVGMRRELTPAPTPPKPTDPKPPPTYKWEHQIVKNICLIRHKPETMIGVDFFVNGPNPPGTAAYEAMKSLDDLISWKPATGTAPDLIRPAMFCIGTDRRMVGTTGTVSPARAMSGFFSGDAATDSDSEAFVGSEGQMENTTSSESEPDVVDLLMSAGSNPPFRMTGRAITSAANQVSIVTLIVWRTSKRISYYAAGDLDATMEAKIVEWTGSNAVKVIKASHHGAPGSFPHNMLKTWKPAGIIFSCGTAHSHPAWEIIYWISVEPKTKGKPIWGTCYPAYLDLVPPTGDPTADADRAYVVEAKDFSIKGVDDKLFIDELEKLYKCADPPGFPQVRLNVQINDTTTVPNKTRWLLNMIGQKWLTLSNTAVVSTAFAGHHDDLGNIATVSEMVWYLKVECRGDLAADGLVTEFRNKGLGAPRKKMLFSDTKPPPRPSKPVEIVSTYKMRNRAARSSSSEPPTKRKSFVLKTEPEPELARPSAAAAAAAVIAPETDSLLSVSNATAAAEPTDTGFYVYEIDVPGTPHVVVTAPQQTMFIRHLHRRVLELVKKFSTDEEESVDFQPGDEIYTWLQTAVGATSLSARGKDTDIYHFDLTTGLAAGPGTIGLAFSTESIPLQFGITPADLGAIPISEFWGTVKMYPIMIFALSPLAAATGSENPKLTLKDLFTYANLGDPILDLDLELVHPLMGSDATMMRRNAIWFQPGADYKTTMRLNFTVSELPNLNSFLQLVLGDNVQLKTADVALKRNATYKLVSTEGYQAQIDHDITIVTTVALSLGTTRLDFSLILMLSEEGGEFNVILDFDEGADIFGVIVDWLGSLLGLDTDFKNWLNGDWMGSPKLSRVMLKYVTVNGESKFVSGTVTFQLDFKWGTETPEEKAVIFFTYSWPPGRLAGSLWPGYQYIDPYALIYPEYESFYRLVPKGDGENVAGGLHLSKLIPELTLVIPEHVLPDINSANIVLDKDQIYFDGSLVWNTGGKFGLPFIELSEVRLAAAYNWKQKNTFLTLNARGLLTPETDDLPAADLFGSITYYSQTGWSFEAMIANLYLSSLYSFFDDDVSDGVMDMLQTIELDLLRVKLDYDSVGGKSSTFIIYGDVLLGPIKAHLEYIHDLSGWSFNIGVGANTEAQATLGDIMHSLAGRNVSLPDCVSSIALVKKSTDTDTFTVNVRRITNDPSAGEHLICHANFTLGGLGFTFVQLRKTGRTTATTPTKRVIKLAVNPLPSADVPLVGSVPQLFDEMTFMWVEDSAGVGLTRKEVEMINTTIWTGSSSSSSTSGQGIKFKDPQPNNQRPTDIVLQKGLHFLIAVTHLGASKVILDHKFGETRNKNNGSTLFSSPSASSDQEGVLVKSAATGGGGGGGAGEVTMAPMQKKVGPLSVSNIGLQFQNNTLFIVLDATFELGPMSMSLLGFGIGVNFSNGGFNLQNIPSSLEVKLEGLGIGFDKQPISMAGQFRYSSIDNLYRGGITVAFRPYVFLAAGFYGNMKGEYKTVFVFAKLTGPLITLGFAEIAGICGGFGYNNKMTFPTVVQIPSFPFIGDNMGDQSPMDALQQLVGDGGWVQPKQDVYWLIAGMSVKAFRLLSVEAVMVIEFNPYVSLGLFGLCQAGFPARAVGGVRFLFIELGIAASLDFEAGTLKIEGQLTPNSFILAPSCHLTGGFALFYWFGEGNANRGDWMFSIGGFHPSFVRPAHYPNPPRLGVSWTLDSALSITGESYFAITPKCCMAGGRLRAMLSLGPLGAWFDAQTNLLVNFNPFFFKGDVSVSVGVRFTLDLWIVTLRISVEIGAQLYLQGPPFAGRVHVNFWVFGFNIDFGPDPVPAAAVDLDGFWAMVLQDGMVASPSSARERRRRRRRLRAAGALGAAAAPGGTGDHVLAVQSGLLPSSSSSSEDADTWDVRAGVFAFCVQSRFAVQEATCVTGGATVSDSTPIYAKPMQLTQPLSSKMEITITKHNPTVRDAEVDLWQLSKVVKAVPDALWGIYNRSEDPTTNGNNINALLSGTNITIPLTMDIVVTSPRPILSKDNIPKFNFIHAMAQDVFNGPGETRPDFPTFDDAVGADFLPDKPDSVTPPPPNQWTAVKEAWAKPEAATAAVQCLGAWRKAFGWEDKEKVKAEPPKFAVRDFEEVYMSAPLLCFAVTA